MLTMMVLVAVSILLTSFVVVTVADPVPVEHAPWRTGVNVCAKYFTLTDVTEECRSDSFDIPILSDSNVEVITASMLRTAVAQACRPEVLGPYVQCVRDRTAGCEPGDRAVVLAEVETFYSRCQDQSTVANWIYDYALNGFGNIEPACLDSSIYTNMCTNMVGELRVPSETTPISEALAMAKYNSMLLLPCVMQHVHNVAPTMPGCSATWQDVFIVILLQMTENSRLGFRVYPELVPLYQDIRTANRN